MAKSRKRSRAAKLAWRRKRNPIRRHRRRSHNPVVRRRRRRRNPYAVQVEGGQWMPSRKGATGAQYFKPAWGPYRKSRKLRWGAKRRPYKARKRTRRSGYAPRRRRRTRKGAARRRSYSRAYSKRRTRRRGRTIFVYPKRRHSRSRAMKAAWRRRKYSGGLRRLKIGRRRRFVTSRGRRYKHAYQTRGGFHFWRNPGFNMAGLKEVALPVGLAIAGILAANFLMKKVQEQTFYAKIPVVAGFNLAGLIPAVVGIAGIAFLAKKMPAQAGMLKGLGFGLILASGATVWNQLVAPKLGATAPKVAFGGYVTESMEGYVRSPLAGYVRSMGQLDEGFSRSLGESVQYRGELAPLGVPSDRALDYETATVKPYGLGLPAEERRYNDFAWRGVYGKGVYEGK